MNDDTVEFVCDGEYCFYVGLDYVGLAIYGFKIRSSVGDDWTIQVV